MKRTIISALIIFAAPLLYSQDGSTLMLDAGNTKYIEVTGSAEMDIEPDNIKLHISLQEYFKEEYMAGKQEKDWVTKVPIEIIETEVLNELKKAGIPERMITVYSIGDNYRWYWRNNERKSKIFEIKFENINDANNIVNKLKVKGVNDISIFRLDNSKIAEYRKTVKINALKAAKEKAQYLVESIGEKLGQAIRIEEANNENSYYRYQTNALSNQSMATVTGDNTGELQSRKINLRYEMKVRFEIK